MLHGNSLGTQIEEPEARIDGVWTWEKNTISIGNMMMGFCFFPNIFRRTQMREVDSVWNAYQNICGFVLLFMYTVYIFAQSRMYKLFWNYQPTQSNKNS